MPSTATMLHVLTLAAMSLAPVVVEAQTAGTFKYVGLSGVSAQQMFLGRPGKVYIVDKTERNNATVNGHPAWATEYDLATNTFRPMDILSNSFCAGGTVLANGTWLNVGGNQAITYGGVAMPTNQQTGQSPYKDYDGGKAMRFLDPTDDGNSEWLDDPAMYMTSRRWYPTLETLEDGSAIVLGGCEWGGYVNYPPSATVYGQNNPTVEYWPSKGIPFTLQFLLNTMPVNLFPLTWLLPSGNLFIQAEFQAEIFDYKNTIEYPIANIPDAVRVYPASAGTAMLPLTPGNNWTATLLFCGGTNLPANGWGTDQNIAAIPAVTSCVKITPDVDVTWYQEDALDSGRSMGNFINLPDGRLLLLNGARTGTAGYGNDTWAIGQSYADNPQLTAWYFDPSKPAGQKWAKAGSSSIPRMYHSAATLLPDGTVLVSGSNPNADYMPPGAPGIRYPTGYQVEIFYPDYADKRKPAPTGMPTRITYGGQYFTLNLTSDDLSSNPANLNRTKAVIARTGFSTHTMNMGMRHVELDMTYNLNDSPTNSTGFQAALNIAQLPPNPAILAPGPALFFLVVNGVPSQASWIMVGDGTTVGGPQPLLAKSSLPGSTVSAQVMANYGLA